MPPLREHPTKATIIKFRTKKAGLKKKTKRNRVPTPIPFPRPTLAATLQSTFREIKTINSVWLAPELPMDAMPKALGTKAAGNHRIFRPPSPSEFAGGDGGSFSSFIISFSFHRAICKAGVVTAERIQFTIGPDDVGAAAVNAVLVPGGGIHEGLDEEPEGVGFIQLELLEQFAERLGFATAFHQVFQFVTDFGSEKALHVFEINWDRRRAGG
jgi:hypothetical protein